MNPKLTYPSHIPTCIATMKIDIVCVDKPTPPSVVGAERYDGTHKFKPHHAYIVAAFMAVRKIAIRTGNLDFCRGDDSCRECSSQICGSFTFCRIQNVKSAGAIPTKNTALQPNL